jgi:hypothetical protein
MGDSSDEESAPRRVPVPARPPPPPGLRPDDLPALFWDEMPEGEDNADLAAINALIEETTPEERAAGFKDAGNRALKAGLAQRKKFYLRQAVEQYTEGLGVGGTDAGVTSALLSNRAHVNLLLGNFRNAMLDGRDAVRFDPGNLKGHYRAAKGALGLRQWDECRKLVAAGLAAAAHAGGGVPSELEALAAAADAGEAREAAAAAAEAVRQREARAPAAALADALLGRGWRVGVPQFGVGDRQPRVEGGEVHWPVLLFYPEAAMQSDTVEDFAEGDTFGDHLDVMFGPEAPPLAWDAAGRYRREAVQVFYLSHGATPLTRDALVEALYGGWPAAKEEGPRRYGPDAAGWVRVREGWTLGEALSREDHVVPGIPVFFVLAAGTPFRERFLEGDVPLL